MERVASLPLDFQLVVQTILYFTSVILGLVISVPTGVTATNFKSNCILYGEVTWANSSYFSYTYGSKTTCNFLVYFSVVVLIFYSLGMGVYNAYAVCKKDRSIGSQMWIMPFIFINSVVTVVTFIAACVISVGFSRWCQSFMSGKSKGANIHSCIDGQSRDWNRGGTVVNGETYYDYLTVAQAASWVSFFIWIVQFVLCVIRALRNRWLRMRDSYCNDPADSDQSSIVKNEPTA